MPGGDVVNIDHIQSRVEPTGDATVQEVEHDLARRRRRPVERAQGQGGLDKDDGHAFGACSQYLVLGHVLRLLVEAEEMSDPSPSGLVRGVAVLGPVQADRADSAGVDDPFDPLGPGRSDHVQASPDIDVVEVRRVGCPEPVHRGDVEDHAAPAGSGDNRGRVPQVRHDMLDRKALEVGG